MFQQGLLKIIGVIGILIFLLTPLIIAHEDAGVIEVRYTIEFSQDDVSFGKVDRYDAVFMKGTAVFSELGKPVLPEKNLNIAIPRGTEVIAVQARSVHSYLLPGMYYIMPGQPPLMISEATRTSSKKTVQSPRKKVSSPQKKLQSPQQELSKGTQLQTKPNDLVYKSNATYPGKLARFVHQSDLAGQEIAEVVVYPLQYVPNDQKLVLHKRIELVVKCRLSKDTHNERNEYYNRFTEKQRRFYEGIIRAMVVNPQDVFLVPQSGELSRALPDGEYDHVIITSSTYVSDFQPLVEWHTKKGVKDTVVTTSWIYANYTGPGDTTKIREFVIDAAANWGTMYFLIGGEKTIVPFAYRNYYEQNTPSDHYYSDYDDDWINEVFVGRVSIDAPAQVNTFVNKVLKYEIDPPLTAYPLDVLLIGMDADASTPLEDVKETIAGWIPSHFNITKVYDSHSGNHKIAAINALDAGQNLVNHADHANETSMGVGSSHGWYIYRSDVNNLVNDDKMSIVVSLSCEANKMDYSDCIAERWVIFNDYQAGVAFTGNTRHGYFYSGQPSSLSGVLDKKWWQGLFNYDQNDLGKALVYSQHNFSQGTAVKKHCEWTFSLLGEPEMMIWTDTPEIFDVTHPSKIYKGMMRHFKVTVTSGASSVESTYVCLWKEDEIYKRGYTDAAGEVTLTILPTSIGTLYVTVTKHNYLPYLGETIVKSGMVHYPDSIVAKPDTNVVPFDSIIPWP